MCDASLGFHLFQCKIYVMFFWWFRSFQRKIYICDFFGGFVHFNAKYKWCFFVVSFISVQDICDVFFLWFCSFQCKIYLMFFFGGSIHFNAKIYVMFHCDFIHFNARYMWYASLWFHLFECKLYDMVFVVSSISMLNICDMLLCGFIYLNASYTTWFLWFHPFQC
jgi:hypothetical protein